MATEHVDGPKAEQLSLEFLLRHVDDEPTIADYRLFHQAVNGIRETALGFAVIGEVQGATKLLEIVKNQGLDPFKIDDGTDMFRNPCMYFAWEATLSWPSCVPEEERTEDKLQELESQGRKLWLERFSEEWEVSEETAKKALDMAYMGISTTLPDYNGSLAGQVDQAEVMWKNGDFSYAANPNGPMTVRYAKAAMWWRQGIYPYPYVQVYRTAGLMIALDIYLRMGNDQEAQGVFETICGRFHYEEQVAQLACSRMAWKRLLTVPARPILDLLNIHAAKLRPAVSRAVQMAEHRLENGPRQRYKNASMEKLAHAVSENTFQNCPYDVLAACRPPGQPRDRPGDAAGLLGPGCSTSEIAALEERLGATLPGDYKEFLSVTNGLGSMWDGQNPVDYLVSAKDVCWQNVDFLGENELPLLRESDPTPSADNRLDWPQVAEFRCICLLGDLLSEKNNGHLFLLDGEFIQPSKDYFFRTYDERNEDQQRELRRVVEETYGSM
ncbi:hypothetical protein FZEAL_3070 [Fusarium zealandicum]|uniref:Knr4/Smi1-like domain-containing protein n=1 Tax=Fusarium zealandicum TaxID=1053134 RepID=A0A8H4UQ55_9HYPO|nr:hypothetical protein FZEAL_3070 [Fusarium zealandicum]